MYKTQTQILNDGGKVLLRSGRFIYSPKAFKKDFKIGDLIEMGIGRVRRISAIGKIRFLSTETIGLGEPWEHVRETARSIRDSKGYRLIKRTRDARR